MMYKFTDQQGNRITAEQFYEGLSKSILANAIALEMAGVERSLIKCYVGPEGGMIFVEDEMLFKTPVTQRLSDEQSTRLNQTFKRIGDDYLDGRISEEELKEIRDGNRVTEKIEMIHRRFQ